jgi:hypothetical protein
VRWVFLTYSFPSCLVRTYLKVFEFGLLLTKMRRNFAHLALKEKALNMRLLQLRTMNFFYKLSPKKDSIVFKCVHQCNYMMLIKVFLKYCPFSFTKSFQSCFFPRLHYSSKAQKETKRCRRRRTIKQACTIPPSLCFCINC